jgi:hypothetical protein
VDSARSAPRGSDPLLIGNANATRSPRDVERDRAGSLSPVSSHAAVNHGECARARQNDLSANYSVC